MVSTICLQRRSHLCSKALLSHLCFQRSSSGSAVHMLEAVIEDKIIKPLGTPQGHYCISASLPKMNACEAKSLNTKPEYGGERAINSLSM